MCGIPFVSFFPVQNEKWWYILRGERNETNAMEQPKPNWSSAIGPIPLLGTILPIPLRPKGIDHELIVILTIEQTRIEQEDGNHHYWVHVRVSIHAQSSRTLHDDESIP